MSLSKIIDAATKAETMAADYQKAVITILTGFAQVLSANVVQEILKVNDWLLQHGALLYLTQIANEKDLVQRWSFSYYKSFY